MSRSIKWRRYLLTLLILIILAAGLIYKLRFSNADALWKIISQ
ncbi:CDP-diacylglycerol diphosphatase, partial [Yersinia pestis]